ncbi:peptidoglycan-binding domain-containing protein [Thalassobaculum sp.]|uniref:peptidoglycan-binding domain-containing protein n=1 Tax=Thalassobaculum sp. TaxID=2022740 RepID=UPI0032EE1336
MKRLMPLTLLGCIGVATPGNALVVLPAVPTTVMATSGIVTVAYDERVERAQGWLNRLGFDAGPVDGYMGNRTRSAISAYQRSRGQVVTGTPDRSTMRSLREEYLAATGSEPRDRSSQTASAETNTAVANQSSLPTPGATQLVVDTQVELRRRGYDVPVVNGVIDSKTQEAIRTFERDQRLLVTGQPSVLLLERIRSTDATLSRREMIRSIQATLTERGYQPGPSDGVMGQATINAIRTYQTDAGLPVDGVADAALLASFDKPEPVVSDDRTKPAQPSGEVMLMDDRFADGDYTREVRWQVLQGNFAVRDGVLNSQVLTAESAQKTSPEDVVLRVLKGVLGEGVEAPSQAQSSAAVITTAVAMPNEFRIRVRLSTKGETGARFAFGPYESEPNTGYELVLDDFPRAVPSILAMRQGSEIRVVRRGTVGTDFADGRMHEIDWVRDASGSMTVSVDGKVVLQTQDYGFSQPFDGLVMVNAHGSWSVDQVRVDAPVH